MNIKKDECIFTDCYCEENVYKFIEKVGTDDFVVLIISNPEERVPIWNQTGIDELTIWDYHVILVNTKQKLVYDLSSKLDFPISIQEYFKKSFFLNLVEKELSLMVKKVYFKWIEAKDYIDKFSSDRSHMKKNGKWLMPPPKYDIIFNGKNNLQQLKNMKDQEHGKVFSFNDIVKVLFH